MNKHCVHQSHTKQYFCKSRPSTSRLNIKHVEALTTQSGSSFHTPMFTCAQLGGLQCAPNVEPTTQQTVLLAATSLIRYHESRTS